MKIYVMYEFKEGPYGGANQFLKAVKSYFSKMGYVTEKLEEADIVLFNSSNYTKEVVEAKRKFPSKIFVERLDGPAKLYLYKNKHDRRDLIANMMNLHVADATIFQSNYSREANYLLGLNKNRLETTIINAPDGEIFNSIGKKEFNPLEKTKLIASSWSSNWNKGFEVYQYLDNHLDFERYEMIFVGNSPVHFSNIKMLKPLPSKELANLMKTCDVYITASENDPCSNSLIEALFCGLPALALKKGGHPEIVAKTGLLFEKKEEIPFLLDEIKKSYEMYSKSSKLLNRDETGDKYIQFLKLVCDDKETKKWKTKTLSGRKLLWLQLVLFYVKLSDKVWRTIKK